MTAFDARFARELVDAAFRRFGDSRDLAEANEATTRCELIDAVLRALDWPDGTFDRESATAAGDFLDYVLPCDGHGVLVVEAKRSGQTFALDDGLQSGSSLRSITTLLKRGGASLREVLKQAAGYCNDRGIPYACVTNGYQWIFFRGLSSQTMPWASGRAYSFASAKQVLEHFDDFIGCIGRHMLATAFLPRLLFRPTTQELPPPRVPLHQIQVAPSVAIPEATSARRSAATYLFTEIHGGDRQEMLRYCYVQPGVLPQFDQSLRRLLRDTMAADPSVDEPVQEGGSIDFVETIRARERTSPFTYPVLVVGHVGVGKTTFLHSALASLRATPLGDTDAPADSEPAVFAYVDLENLGTAPVQDYADEQRRTAQLILQRLVTSAQITLSRNPAVSAAARAEADPTQQSTMRTMLRKRLKAARDTGRDFFERFPDEWLKKEYQLIEEYQSDACELLLHYIRHLRARFARPDGLKYPILIVLDNLDLASDDYQKCIYSLALRLAKQTPAVVIVSLREDTYRRGKAPDGFLSSSPLEFVFHVPAPPLDQLLRQRLRFVKQQVDQGTLPRGLKDAATDMLATAELVNGVLLQQPLHPLEVLAALSGHNIRSALRFVREFIVGAAVIGATPGPTIEFFLQALFAVVGHQTLEARLGLANCFDANPTLPPLHALRLRLLAYFAWVYDLHAERGILEGTDHALSRFAAWGYPPYAVEDALQTLLLGRLLESPLQAADQTSFHTLPRRLAISAAGYAHLMHLAQVPGYRAAMALLTRWYDADIADEFTRRILDGRTDETTTVAAIVETQAVALFDAYLTAAVAREDLSLSSHYQNARWVREVLARSSRPLHGEWAEASSPPELSSNQAPVRTPELGQQLSLFPSRHVQLSLRRLPKSLVLHGSVWVPRILWALERARLDDRGLVTAAEIARILVNDADIDVPGTNVARAFRDFRENPDLAIYWSREGKKYSITTQGTAVIQSCIQSQHVDGGA